MTRENRRGINKCIPVGAFILMLRASCTCSMLSPPRLHGPFGPACKWNATSGIAISRFGESQKPRSIIKPRLEQYRGAIYFGCATDTMFWVILKSI